MLLRKGRVRETASEFRDNSNRGTMDCKGGACPQCL